MELQRERAKSEMKWYGISDVKEMAAKQKEFQNEFARLVTGDEKKDIASFIFEQAGVGSPDWNSLGFAEKERRLSEASSKTQDMSIRLKAMESVYPNAPATRVLRSQLKMLETLKRREPSAPTPQSQKDFEKKIMEDPNRMAQFMEEFESKYERNEKIDYMEMFRKYSQ